MLHCQDSLHSGPLSPATLAAADITTLLPSSEDDFDAGRQPESRAALQDSRPGQDQHLIHDPRRSLFASVLQAHQFWAMVSRSAIGRLHSPSPWDRTSEFSRMAKRLEVWEQELPPAHVWRPILVKSYKERDEETVRFWSNCLRERKRRPDTGIGISLLGHDDSSLQHHPPSTVLHKASHALLPSYRMSSLTRPTAS